MRLSELADRITAPMLGHLWPRWLWLRGLGLIFLSAFYSLACQIHGLVGEHGILPVRDYLPVVSSNFGSLQRYWYAPTLLWLSPTDAALTAIVVAGLACSVLLIVNVWPRASVALCTLLFLSCVAALQDFSSYQSDGMLLEAGLLSCFFAPRGMRPGLGASQPPSRASDFMLRWEWFRIYLESGIVKLASGDPHWRDFTAMDEYYQNGPLPTWLGWYVQHFPHWYHAMTVVITFAVELGLVWAVWMLRRFRLLCFAGVTALQVGIIATANYAFLNYLVLLLGVLLLDDELLARIGLRTTADAAPPRQRPQWRRRTEAAVMTLLFYTTIAAFAPLPLPLAPVRLLDPFRVANAYGLFATMTEARYEIEFQGSRDGRTWIAYPFRYKPQPLDERPGIYAPYQPRFDWNLWFASLGPWQQSTWVVLAQQRLLEGSPSVLHLFRSDPFHGHPPAFVRTVLWQYWFTDAATHRATGAWWRRRELGPFTGTIGTAAPDTVAAPSR